MLLLLTGSGDGSADRIVSRFDDDQIFRFNFDLWADYELTLTPNYWQISSPCGHKISSETVTRAFFWKAFHFYLLDTDHLISSEVKYIFRELYNWCAMRNLLRGTPYAYHNKMGKISILSIAKEHFSIPATLITIKNSGLDLLSNHSVVAKSLSSAVSSEQTVLATTEIELNQLHPAYPWYLQEKIESDWDITVFQCGTKLFAFRRSRADLKGVDWRTEQKFDDSIQEWFPFELTDDESNKVKCLSNDLGIDFGRYDFMSSKLENRLIFLEYNANGQWVFLDPHDKFGLLDQVVNYLS